MRNLVFFEAPGVLILDADERVAEAMSASVTIPTCIVTGRSLAEARRVMGGRRLCALIVMRGVADPTGFDVLAAAREHDRDLPALIVATAFSPDEGARAFRANASYIPRDVRTDRVVEDLTLYLRRHVRHLDRRRMAAHQLAHRRHLTRRAQGLMEVLADGVLLREAHRALGVGVEAVKARARELREGVGVGSIEELIRLLDHAGAELFREPSASAHRQRESGTSGTFAKIYPSGVQTVRQRQR